MRTPLLERSHVDDEAVLHVVFEEAVVGLVDLLNGDFLDVRGDCMVSTEVEHLLGFLDATDGGAGETVTAEEQIERRDTEGFFRRSDEGHGTVPPEKTEVNVDIVVGRDAIEDEIETTGLLLHF